MYDTKATHPSYNLQCGTHCHRILHLHCTLKLRIVTFCGHTPAGAEVHETLQAPQCCSAVVHWAASTLSASIYMQTLQLNMRYRCSIHADCVQVTGGSNLVLFTLERPRAQQPGLCCMVAGTNSYVLFTLDKLIAKVMKAFQGLMQDPLACKLFDMYKYECSRSVPFADAVYHANTHVVLHEDHCFRLQSQPDGQLNVQLLDPDRTEVPASEYCPSCSL